MIASPALGGEDLVAFRDEVLGVARRNLPAVTLTKDDDPEILHADDFSHYLGNLRATVRELEPADREAEIVKWLKALETFMAGSKERKKAVEFWSYVEPRLRPKLIPADHAEHLKSMVHRPFSQDVVIAYGIDHGEVDAFVMEADLAKWDVEVATVHATAIANLEAMSAAVAIQLFHAPHVLGRYAAVLTGDAYDAARMLLPRFRGRLLAALGQASALAGIPNRDCLVAWTADFVNRDALVAQVRDDVRMQPHPLTEAIFVLTSDAARVATLEELR